MLVLDRIELGLSDQIQKMGKLESHYAFRFQKDRERGKEFIQVGNMGDHIIGHRRGPLLRGPFHAARPRGERYR